MKEFNEAHEIEGVELEAAEFEEEEVTQGASINCVYLWFIVVTERSQEII